MKNFKKNFTLLPEFYILIVVLLTDYTFPFNFNLISVGLSLIVFLQITVRNRMAGMYIATLFFLANLYMPFALMWEFKNFIIVRKESIQFFINGFYVVLFNLLFSVLMIIKFIKQEEKEKIADATGIPELYQNSNSPEESGKAIDASETKIYL
jgi:hypothetical protein